MARRHVFHVIYFEDRGWWVAQCLERNLVAASRDPKELPKKLEAVLRVQVEADQDAGIEPFTTLPQAPRRFWQMFQNAEPLGFDEDTAELSVTTPRWGELAFA